MMYTDEFFLMGQGQNDSLVQLVDSFTGENINFQKVSTWIDGDLLGTNDLRVIEDNIIYRKRGTEYYVNTVVFSSKRIYVTSFGAKSSYSSDQRAAIQKAFDISSKLGLKLVFPSGHFLVNSYTDNVITATHGNVFELRSYLDVEFEEFSVIKMGTFFDDKNFILFSGLNAEYSKDYTDLFNISFQGRGVIDFNGDLSQIRSKRPSGVPVRRIGFEGGRCSNVTIDGLYWVNGDLSNFIGLGAGVYGENISIKNCIFSDLVKSNETFNVDHSTIYGNANFLSVHDNIFRGNSQTQLIGCACEIHSSNSSFNNNKVYKYLRMNFIAGVFTEKEDITNINICDNIAEITSAAIYIWPEPNCTISNLLINSNNIKHIHVQAKSQSYNGSQCLFIIQGKGGNCERITVTNNVSHILYTIGDHLRYAAGIHAHTEMLNISNNQFVGHSLGILFGGDDQSSSQNLEYSYVKILNNNFSSSTYIVTFNVSKVSNTLISQNVTTLTSDNLEDLIRIKSDIIDSTIIKDNVYLLNQPKVEFIPSLVFLADSSNKAKYILSFVKTAVPTINADNYNFITPVFPDNHKRTGAMYTIQPTYPFYELFFNAHTFGSGGMPEVKFKVDNITQSIFSGNPDLLSHILVDM